MAIQINSAGIVPNPINAGGFFILSVDISEYLMEMVGLYDGLGSAIFDSVGKRIMVKNDEITALKYDSAYTSTVMNNFISKVLGV